MASWRFPFRLLIDRFGKSYGAWLRRRAWAASRPRRHPAECVSMSMRRRPLSVITVRDRAVLGRILDRLCERLALTSPAGLRQPGGIKLPFEGFPPSRGTRPSRPHYQAAAGIAAPPASSVDFKQPALAPGSEGGASGKRRRTRTRHSPNNRAGAMNGG